MRILAVDEHIESTREKILRAAHEEMYKHGYQGLRIDIVLKRTSLAKGALYHYFPDKIALGYAVLDEVISGNFQQGWSEFLNVSSDPIVALRSLFDKLFCEIPTDESFNGCPLTNLIQEMSNLDTGFQTRLRMVTNNIVSIVTLALKQGQVDRVVRQDLNIFIEANFLLSSYQGIMSSAKCMQSKGLAKELFETLKYYIESWRKTD